MELCPLVSKIILRRLPLLLLPLFQFDLAEKKRWHFKLKPTEMGGREGRKFKLARQVRHLIQLVPSHKCRK